MSNQLKNTVEAIISEWTNKGYMFSAFDVTKKVRHGGTTAAHWEVRDLVRNEFHNGNMSTYIRTLVTLPSSESFVYHPITADSSKYNADWFTTDPTQDNMISKGVKTQGMPTNVCTIPNIFASTFAAGNVKAPGFPAGKLTTLSGSTVSTVSTGSPVPIGSVSKSLNFTNDLRLNIGPEFIKHIKSDEVQVAEKAGNLEITGFYGSKTDKKIHCHYYKVNQDQRIRIPSVVIENMLGHVVPALTDFSVSLQNDKIVISV